MSNAIVWSPTATAIAGYTTGANGAQAAALLAALNTAGSVYDTAYAGAGVDAAKTAWLTTANAIWSQANSACRYIESLSGSPAAALTFNAYDTSALVARLSAASGNAGAVLQPIIAAQIAAVKAWDADPNAINPQDNFDPYLSPRYTSTASVVHDRYPYAGGVSVTAVGGVITSVAGETHSGGPATYSGVGPALPSVRALELALNQQLVDAAQALALFAYV